jgi:hypothetical protein
LLTMFTDQDARFELAEQALAQSPITIGAPTEIMTQLPLIIERIS